MKRALLSAAVAVAVVAGVSAQDARSFAGTWRTDMSRSQPGSGGVGPDLTIAVDGTRMTITRTTAGNSSSKVYLLDGTPWKDEGATVTSKWEGNVLVTITSVTDSQLIEKRSIQPDGAMKVDITYNFGKAAQEQRGPGRPVTESFYRIYTKIK